MMEARGRASRFRDIVVGEPGEVRMPFGLEKWKLVDDGEKGVKSDGDE